MTLAGDITQLLREADEGRPDAAGRLFALVADDLRAIAHKRRSAAVGDGPNTTMIVHDAFLRLVGQDATTWQAGARRKFFGYFARKVQDVLIDDLRARQAQKRGGQYRRVEAGPDLEDAGPRAGENLDLLLDLRGALDRFEQFAPDDALLFRLRCFLGCTFEEMAEVASVSVAEAKRAYQRTQLWLRRELKAYAPDE